MTIEGLLQWLNDVVSENPAWKDLPIHVFSDPEGNQERGVWQVGLDAEQPTCLLIVPDDTLHNIF